MKSLVILFACLVLSAFAWAADRNKPLHVVTSTQDLASIAEMIGGDKVSVTSISNGMQDPHFVPPRPSYMLKLRNADLLIRTGMELDIWLDPLIEGSRNQKLFRNGPGYVDASQGIHIIGNQASKIDRSLGDVHPYGNPHYWLDPLNAKYISLNIVNGLKRTDPADADYFDARRLTFLKQLASHLTVWLKEAQALKGLPVITYHDSWPYFAQRFGLDIVTHLEPKPGIPPSPKYLGEVIRTAQVRSAKLIMVEPFYNRASADTVAQASGGKVLILPPSVGGAPGINTYFDLFDYDLNALLKAR